jgi:hypothetical protein
MGYAVRKLKPRGIFSFRTAWIVRDVRSGRVDVLLQLRARRLDELEARLGQLLGQLDATARAAAVRLNTRAR